MACWDKIWVLEGEPLYIQHMIECVQEDLNGPEIAKYSTVSSADTIKSALMAFPFFETPDLIVVSEPNSCSPMAATAATPSPSTSSQPSYPTLHSSSTLQLGVAGGLDGSAQLLRAAPALLLRALPSLPVRLQLLDKGLERLGGV